MSHQPTMQNHHQGRQRHHQGGMLSSLHERRNTNYSRDSGSPKLATLVIKPIAAGTTVAGTRCGINQIVAGKIAAGQNRSTAGSTSDLGATTRLSTHLWCWRVNGANCTYRYSTMRPMLKRQLSAPASSADAVTCNQLWCPSVNVDTCPVSQKLPYRRRLAATDPPPAQWVS